MFSSRFVRIVQAPIRPAQRWCHAGGNSQQNAGGNLQNFPTLESIKKITSNWWVRRVSVGVLGWFGSISLILWYSDRMRYKRTVNTFYDNFERATAINVNRNTEEQIVKDAIKDGTSMSVFYGPNSAGKSHLVSNACAHIVDEPVFYLEIVNPQQFLEEFVENLKYYGDEEVSLSNYFKWINPVFALGYKSKPDPTLDNVIVHLKKCEKWLEKAQNYPWNKIFGRYRGHLNIVLDSFDRLISLDSSSMAQSLIQSGKQGIDSKGIRLNFIFSEGTLANFSGIAGTGAAKRITVYEIAAIDEVNAIKYLQKNFKQKYNADLPQERAEEAYKVCGGLFDDMNVMITKKANVKAFKENKYRDFSANFVELGLFISPDDKKLAESELAAWEVLQMVDSEGEIGYREAIRIFGDNKGLLNTLTGKKGPLSLAIGEYPKYKFTSTPMANYVKKVIAECASSLN